MVLGAIAMDSVFMLFCEKTSFPAPIFSEYKEYSISLAVAFSQSYSPPFFADKKTLLPIVKAVQCCGTYIPPHP